MMANSKRRCRNCKTYYLWNHEYPAFRVWCSDECATGLAMKRLPRTMKKKAKEEKQGHVRQKREYFANNLPHQLELTRKVFNTFIRVLDRGKLCPTCEEPLIEGFYDAGHVRTVASCPQLRFEPKACFGQCRRCNGSGTIRKRTKKTQEVVSELYKEWILKTYGQSYYDWLYGPHTNCYYSCDELVEIRLMFAAETRRLEKGEKPSRDWRAIE